MRKRDKFLLFTLAPLCCALLTGGLVVVAKQHGLGSNEAAAWVQAVGSIAALGIAIYVMSRQNAHATRLVTDADRLTALRRAKSVHAVLLRTREQLSIMETHMMESPQGEAPFPETKRKFKVALEMLDLMEPTLNSIPAYDLGSFDMADGALQFAQLLSSVRGVAQSLHQDPDDAGSPMVKNIVDSFRHAADDAMQKFERGMTSLER